MPAGFWARLGRLLGVERVPEGFRDHLEPEERPVAVATGARGSSFMATNLGLWVPAGDEVRRMDWHLITKATWSEDILTVTEAERIRDCGAAVLLRDRPRQRFALAEPGKLPDTVHARVTGSIASSHHRELPGGGAWFVQRKVPGQGVVLQVRADPGTDPEAVTEVAAAAAERLRRARGDPE